MKKKTGFIAFTLVFIMIIAFLLYTGYTREEASGSNSEPAEGCGCGCCGFGDGSQ